MAATTRKKFLLLFNYSTLAGIRWVVTYWRSPPDAAYALVNAVAHGMKLHLTYRKAPTDGKWLYRGNMRNILKCHNHMENSPQKDFSDVWGSSYRTRSTVMTSVLMIPFSDFQRSTTTMGGYLRQVPKPREVFNWKNLHRLQVDIGTPYFFKKTK